MEKIRVTVWNEFRHEREEGHKSGKVYPEGLHKVIAEFLSKDEGIAARTATLDEPLHGLSDEVLDNTDVLMWWGHGYHDEVSDEIVKKIQDRILKGMGLIVLHSGHYSKIFRTMMGTSCLLRWRDGDRERVWCCKPSHPIADGIPEYFEIPEEEMYGEFFDIPEPDDLIFMGWFKGGEVFRSGCTFHRGHGKIFYFQPGHEEYPVYYIPEVQKVINNAVHWVNPQHRLDGELFAPNPEALEK